MRHVSVASFTGPLDLLLQLIEQEKLDISQVSLAAVTEQYIAALQKLEELPLDELADFLVVAAKLLVIKSRLLVPGQADEDDLATDLERQLKMYQAFVEATKDVAKLYNRHRVSYPREGWVTMDPIFNPPEKLTPADLHTLFIEVLRSLEPIVRLPQTVVIRTINIRQKIDHIRAHLEQQKTASFHQLLQSASSKTEVIITFLAVLELVKQQSVTVAQSAMYADLVIAAMIDETTQPA